MKLFTGFALSTLALFSGCVTTVNLSKAEGPPASPEETILVFGVQPRYRIGLAKGRIDGTKWNRDHSSVATANIFPDDGYIVVKVPSRSSPETYGVAQILPEGIGGFVPRYLTCTGQNLVVLPAPPGKVVYVGDIEYKIEKSTLQFIYSYQPEKAKEFLASNYPTLSSHLEFSKASILTMNNTNCGPATIYVPIFR